MFSTIWNLIPVKIKVISGIGLVLIVLGIVGVFSWQSNKIDSLNKDLIICEEGRKRDKIFYDSELDKAYTVINTQNESIKQFKVDEKDYQVRIKKKDEELLAKDSTKQQNIAVELHKDSSSDNQLRMIREILKEFSDEDS